MSFFKDKNCVSDSDILLNFKEKESNSCLKTKIVLGVITNSKDSWASNITYIAVLSLFSDSNPESEDSPEKISIYSLTNYFIIACSN